MTEKIKVAAGVLMLLIMGSSAEAAVCYLPSPGCGLQTPAVESNPTPSEEKCTGGLYEECPKIDSTLQKCEKQGECYKVSCLYSGFSNCVANSSTNYCEIDASTGCYKKAEAPAVCVGYDDTYEKTLDENCSCQQCEDDASKYKCECTDPVPETCKSYGDGLTPPKIYDTVDALTCSDAQKKQKIGVIKNEEECYECVAKTCTDYGEFEQGKGNCGANEKEEQDTSTGCYKCVEKPAESDQVCVKLVFNCTDSTGKHACSRAELNDMGITMYVENSNDSSIIEKNLTITNSTGEITYSSVDEIKIINAENIYCFNRQELTQILDKYDAKADKDNKPYDKAEPYDVLIFNPELSADYAKNEDNSYTFVNTNNAIITALTVIRKNNQINYVFNEDVEADNSIYNKYYQCLHKNQVSPTYDEAYECTWNDVNITPLNSSIDMEINLVKFTGSPKCVYYAATCYHLPQNAKDTDKLKYIDAGNGYYSMGSYFNYKGEYKSGLYSDILVDGKFPNYPNNQISLDCISSAEISITNSGNEERTGKSYNMTQMTTEQLKKKYAETQNEFFNPQKDTVVLQNCELQDWDKGNIYVYANNAYTNFFDKDYVSDYNTDVKKNDCLQIYSFNGAYYDVENNKVKVPYASSENRQCFCYGAGYGVIACNTYHLASGETLAPANGNFTYAHYYKEYNFAYTGGYTFLDIDSYRLTEIANYKNYTIPAQTVDFYQSGKLYPSSSISVSASRTNYDVSKICAEGYKDSDTTYYSITSTRPLNINISLYANSFFIFSGNHKGYMNLYKASGSINDTCQSYEGESTKTNYSTTIPEFERYKQSNWYYNDELDYDYMITDDNYFYWKYK